MAKYIWYSIYANLKTRAASQIYADICVHVITYVGVSTTSWAAFLKDIFEIQSYKKMDIQKT